ncbi:uncharacterized protein LOC114023968 [Vombatus ursinus]|uniref:uncharacterized protein LOC114023968 n=1 Tax=Vombatus ursinus TaxID=29139 RepID=UPI000FFD84A1|nr:uncharacterized protein LOC114023968 [Vombatus ursinus]
MMAMLLQVKKEGMGRWDCRYARCIAKIQESAEKRRKHTSVLYSTESRWAWSTTYTVNASLGNSATQRGRVRRDSIPGMENNQFKGPEVEDGVYEDQQEGNPSVGEEQGVISSPSSSPDSKQKKIARESSQGVARFNNIWELKLHQEDDLSLEASCLEQYWEAAGEAYAEVAKDQSSQDSRGTEPELSFPFVWPDEAPCPSRPESRNHYQPFKHLGKAKQLGPRRNNEESCVPETGMDCAGRTVHSPPIRSRLPGSYYLPVFGYGPWSHEESDTSECLSSSSNKETSSLTYPVGSWRSA